MHKQKLKQMKNKIKLNFGFTLIELMVTIAVLAILITLAVPSFQTMLASNISATQANELVVALAKTRIEAMKKHRNVVICSSEDQVRCNSTSATADKDNWEKGWIVQLVSEEAKNCASVSCAYIQQKSSFAGSNTIKSINFTDAADGRVIFSRSASIDSPGGSFVICDSRGASDARVVLLGITGNAKVSERKQGGVSDDIVNDNLGVDITCP